MNVTVLIVRVWEFQYRIKLTLNFTLINFEVFCEGNKRELILKITVIIVRFCGEKYREEQTRNNNVLVVRVWERAIQRKTNKECYSVGFECLCRPI